MAILKIIKDDDPILRKVSREVDAITPRIITLLDDMRDTLKKANVHSSQEVEKPKHPLMDEWIKKMWYIIYTF